MIGKKNDFFEPSDWLQKSIFSRPQIGQKYIFIKQSNWQKKKKILKVSNWIKKYTFSSDLLIYFEGSDWQRNLKK
jgi:hypothetical protein